MLWQIGKKLSKYRNGYDSMIEKAFHIFKLKGKFLKFGKTNKFKPKIKESAGKSQT